MDTRAETDKRLTIAKKISSSLQGKAVGIILGGSMGFGQYHSVRDTSDIDMVIITTLDKVNLIAASPYFRGRIPEGVLSLFKAREINFFWVVQEIDNVEVDMFVYESASYQDFCLLKGTLRGFKEKKPSSDIQTTYGFDGSPLSWNRNVTAFNKGFIYEKPALVDGKYWGGVPRQDFFYSGCILLEEDHFLTNLEKETWRTVVKQLVKEYGPNLNLSKVNILNTHYTYQTQRERLPKQVIDSILTRTKRELEKVKFEGSNNS